MPDVKLGFLPSLYPFLVNSGLTSRRVLGLLLVGLVMRLAIALWLYPGFDEAYYYVYTLHPDWSYFDHPPLVMWTTALGIWLTGHVTQFTIRIGSLIVYTGSLIFLYLTSDRLFSRRAAELTLAIATWMPFFLVGFGTLTLPDIPLMFFWSATLYACAIEFFPRSGPYHPTYRLAIISVLVGLTCLGKYHGFVLGAGLVGFCLTSPRHRSVLWSPWTGLGLGLFLLTLSPVLYWNAQHEWVSFTFQSARSVPTRGYNPLDALLTMLVSVAYLFPTLGLPVWWASGRALQHQFLPVAVYPQDDPDLKQKQRLILWAALPLMVGFTLMGGYRQVLPSWPMPGYWSATLLLGYQAAIWQQRSPKTVHRWLKGSSLAIVTALTLALLHVSLGTLQKPSQYAWFGGFWNPKDDPSTQLIDVEQLRRGFTDSPALSQALHQAKFVFGNNFFVAGQVGMALGPITPRPITCFDVDVRGFAFWSQPQEWLGQDGIYITSRYFAESIPQKYGEYFQSFEPLGEIPIRRGGAITEIFQVYRARHLLKPYPWPYGNSSLLK